MFNFHKLSTVRRSRLATLRTASLLIIFAMIAAFTPWLAVIPAQAATAQLPKHPENGGAVIDILALGDSYTAGNGASNSLGGPIGYYQRTPDDPATTNGMCMRASVEDLSPAFVVSGGCFRNWLNYSHDLYATLHSSGAYINRARSGDKNLDLTGPQLGDFDTSYFDDVDLILLSSGGNDGGFADIMQQCFVGLTDNGDKCKTGLDTAKINLPAIVEDTKRRVSATKASFKNAVIVLVGYPQLNEDYNVKIQYCPSIRGVLGNCPVPLLDLYPARVLKELEDAAATLQANAIKTIGLEKVFYLPLMDLYKGHGVGGALDAWIHNQFSSTSVHEWYHPNTQGHAATAQAIYARADIMMALSGSGNQVLREADGTAWYTFRFGNGLTKRVWIPTSYLYSCYTGRYGAAISVVTSQIEKYEKWGTKLQDASCTPTEWRNHVISAPDGSSWYVSPDGRKRHILSVDTFWVLVDRYGPAIKISAQVDVDALPQDADMPEESLMRQLDGKAIRGVDGRSWVISGNARHYVPDYPTDLCRQLIGGVPEVRSGVALDIINSMPQGSDYTCSLNGYVLQALDKPDPKPAYIYTGNKRYWIPDGFTYDYFVRIGWPVVGVPSLTQILSLPDGGTAERKLHPGSLPGNSVIRSSDGTTYVVDPSKVLHKIPYAQDEVCWRYLRAYPLVADGLTPEQVDDLVVADNWPCIIGPRVVKSDSGASYYVDVTNTRHELPDAETFGVYVAVYPLSGPWPAAEVNRLPLGIREPQAIDKASVLNTIICRSDGVCWTVDSSAHRHWIPSYSDFLCWRYVNGWRVSRTGLSAEQSSSGLPEAEAQGCALSGRIMATNEGASYFIDVGRMRWIQDPESYFCYTGRGISVYRGMSVNELRPLGEISAMPRCLDPNRVKKKIVRGVSGVAYFIDAAGWWYWIPNSTVWNCLTKKYPVLTSSATQEQIDSIRRERGIWASCAM